MQHEDSDSETVQDFLDQQGPTRMADAKPTTTGRIVLKYQNRTNQGTIQRGRGESDKSADDSERKREAKSDKPGDDSERNIEAKSDKSSEDSERKRGEIG